MVVDVGEVQFFVEGGEVVLQLDSVLRRYLIFITTDHFPEQIDRVRKSQPLRGHACWSGQDEEDQARAPQEQQPSQQ